MNDLVNILFAIAGGFLGWTLRGQKSNIIPAWLMRLLEEEEQKKKEEEELQRAKDFLEKANQVIQKQPTPSPTPVPSPVPSPSPSPVPAPAPNGGSNQ